MKLNGQVGQKLRFSCMKCGWIAENIVNFVNDSISGIWSGATCMLSMRNFFNKLSE